ncbi:hypothetical protein Pelo_13528 [Pelomyxa schiedti]|nr:hypothetical protein Pelo_13528 [Pelomyxa schiedti]
MCAQWLIDLFQIPLNGMRLFHVSCENLESTKTLDLSHLNLESVPEQIAGITCQKLDLRDNPILNLPPWLFQANICNVLLDDQKIPEPRSMEAHFPVIYIQHSFKMHKKSEKNLDSMELGRSQSMTMLSTTLGNLVPLTEPFPLTIPPSCHRVLRNNGTVTTSFRALSFVVILKQMNSGPPSGRSTLFTR